MSIEVTTTTRPPTQIPTWPDASMVKKNFNPIDLVMAVCECNFLEAIEYLKQKMR